MTAPRDPIEAPATEAGQTVLRHLLEPEIYGWPSDEQLTTAIFRIEAAARDEGRDASVRLREAAERADFALSIIVNSTVDDRHWYEEAVEAREQVREALWGNDELARHGRSSDPTDPYIQGHRDRYQRDRQPDVLCRNCGRPWAIKDADAPPTVIEAIHQIVNDPEQPAAEMVAIAESAIRTLAGRSSDPEPAPPLDENDWRTIQTVLATEGFDDLARRIAAFRGAVPALQATGEPPRLRLDPLIDILGDAESDGIIGPEYTPARLAQYIIDSLEPEYFERAGATGEGERHE